jgi:hypothetical protein
MAVFIIVALNGPKKQATSYHHWLDDKADFFIYLSTFGLKSKTLKDTTALHI